MVEQTNPQGLEYSELRLWRLMKSHAESGPDELQEILTKDLDGFRGQQPQNDDLTFLIVNFH
jgi:serine phosphatase RsbU (regulator of sigma subunit)